MGTWDKIGSLSLEACLLHSRHSFTSTSISLEIPGNQTDISIAGIFYVSTNYLRKGFFLLALGGV